MGRERKKEKWEERKEKRKGGRKKEKEKQREKEREGGWKKRKGKKTKRTTKKDSNLPFGIHHEAGETASLWSPYGFSVFLMSFLSPSAALASL